MECYMTSVSWLVLLKESEAAVTQTAFPALIPLLSDEFNHRLQVSCSEIINS